MFGMILVSPKKESRTSTCLTSKEHFTELTVEPNLPYRVFFSYPPGRHRSKIIEKFSRGWHYTASVCTVALYLCMHLVTNYFHGQFSFSAVCVNSFGMTLNHSAAPIVLD